MSLTPDVRLLLAPFETYAALAAPRTHAPSGDWWRALGRVAVPAGLAGITTTIAATGRISWSLALGGAACWSFIALLQVVTAAAIIVPSKRPLNLPRALELFFLGHAAWSLWLIVSSALLFAAFGPVRHDIVLMTALVPLVWTAVVVFAFFRQVFQFEPRQAGIRTAVHQTLTALIIVLYVGWAVQLWPRVIALQVP